MAVENFKNRNHDLVNNPQLKTNARVGYSVEAIKKELDGVCNSHVDALGTLQPLAGDESDDLRPTIRQCQTELAEIYDNSKVTVGNIF